MAATFEFEAIGTHWKIDFFDKISKTSEASILNEIFELIKSFENIYSRFHENSLIRKMGRVPGVYALPVEARLLFDLYQELYQITEGAFTPLIGQTLVEAGYDADYSLKPTTLHHPPKWEEVLDYQYPYLTIKKPCQLDFGSAGKGYLIDLVSDFLIKKGHDSFCVNAGGDIFYRHAQNLPLKVGLEDPRNFNQVIGVAEILNQSICASAGSRRVWKDFHHIINPHTLHSPKKVLATWVIAESGRIADGLSTCLFLVPPSQLQHFPMEYAILHEDGSLEASTHLPAAFFTESDHC